MHKKVYALVLSWLVACGALYAGCGGSQPQSKSAEPAAAGPAADAGGPLSDASSPAVDAARPPAAVIVAAVDASVDGDAATDHSHACTDFCKTEHTDKQDKAYCDFACDCLGIYCVDENGNPLDDDRIPKMKAGQQLLVRVIGPHDFTVNHALILSEDGNANVTKRPCDDAGGTPAPASSASGAAAHSDAGTGSDGGAAPTPEPDVTVTCVPRTYAVGGRLIGLPKDNKITLRVTKDDKDSALELSKSGAFAFKKRLASGAAYDVNIATSPDAKSCGLFFAAGVVGDGDVTSIIVDCGAPAKWSIGGSVSGLTGPVTLQNNGGDDLTLASNGAFTFPTHVPQGEGAGYAITVSKPPPGQVCTIDASKGEVTKDVSTVKVTCSDTTYAIGGSASGIPLGQTITVLLNGGKSYGGTDYDLTANGAFTIGGDAPVALDFGKPYKVELKTQPPGNRCEVTNASGKIAHDVKDVRVTCSQGSYPLRVRVTGLQPSKTVTLRNFDDTIELSDNGTFEFTKKLSADASYSVTIGDDPPGQSCTMHGDIGTAKAAAAKVPLIGNADHEILISRNILVTEATVAVGPTMGIHYDVVDCADPTHVTSPHPFTLPVEDSYHFLEVGILVPFVLGGDRTIIGTPVPNTGLQTVHVKDDLHVTVGLALNIYPLSVSSSWSPIDTPFKWYDVLRGIGFQAGTTLDFTSASFREWYLGLSWRLMRGATVGGGVAMLRGQFLPNGFVDGMLVPGTGIPQETKYMFRPYLGVTLSTDIITTIGNVFTQISKASATTQPLPTGGKGN